ncbi:ARM repeat-containing protein [Panus rudis PR-1116 ss-1]|nr:ARM repeat-containing protein [Panus rudis PR-1116 ss-1]
MASEIAQCLSATLSPDPNTRISAELKLSELLTQPQSALTLSQLVIAQDAELSLRQSASVLLRKYIKERWSPFFPTFKGSAPPPEVKTNVRHAVFQGLSDPLRKIRSMSALTLSAIASCDWPDEYPDLLSSLIALLSSDSPEAVHGAMQVFVEFVRADLSEDQLLPVLRELLPVMLNILGAHEKHSPLTRARTIAVFRQCVEALYMVKEQHPQAVKEATASVFPTWLDAFKVLLNLDPRQDVENAQHWDGLVIRIEVYKTLNTILTAFRHALTPYLPDILTASLHHLDALYPTFSQCYLIPQINIPRTSEDENVDLTNLICNLFDFVAHIFRSGRAKDWFGTEQQIAFVRAVLQWVQMTTEDEENWANDGNAFVEQESDESMSYGVRLAGFDLLTVLLERSADTTESALNAVTQQFIAEAGKAREAGQNNWWRPVEAALAALGSQSKTIVENIQDAEQAGQLVKIDIRGLLTNVVPNLLVLSQYPFLQGRGFVFASQYTQLLPSELSGQYLNASLQVLESSDASLPVKISAIKAISNFCQELANLDVTPLGPRIARDLLPFMVQTSENILSLVLETVSFLVVIRTESWLTPEIASSLIEGVLNVWSKYNKDPLFLSILDETVGSIAATRVPGVYETVERLCLPPLSNALNTATNETSWVTYSALTLLNSIAEAQRDAPLSDAFFSAIAPGLFQALRTAEDRDVIQSGISLITVIIRKSFERLRTWTDPANGQNGLDDVLAVIAKQLQGEDESGGLFVGDLIIHLLRKAGDAVVPVLPGLLQALVGRMPTAKTATFIQSLIIPFAFLIHNGQRDTVLSLLETTNVEGRSGLDVLIQTWSENAETFQGFWAIRVSTLALCSLYASERPSLQNLMVKGDIIVTEETSNVIMTRSRTKQMPTEWTSIPFPVKALKLILHELQSNGESAAMGLADADISEVPSDDEDESWVDAEPGEGLKGVLNKEELAFLSDVLGPRGANFDEDEALDDIDDDDLKEDPVSKIDMKEHLVNFLKECASRNVNNFSGAVNHLSVDESLVVKKAITGA